MGKRRESFEAVQKSVARVKDTNGQTWGTGFFISREAHLLTCAHVVEDAGGWKNVRILDQPVNCLYEGDPERDDICLLQVEDIQVIPVELGKDFEPGDEFLSFGFSNDDFYGAPIRGEITPFARCGKLGDQKLIRLETFSDAQRIEGGQSGAPVLLYKQGKYRAIGLIVASEDLQGGLAIPTNTILRETAKLNIFKEHRKQYLKYVLGGISVAASSLLILSFQVSTITGKCSAEVRTQYKREIDEAVRLRLTRKALKIASNQISECRNDYQGYINTGSMLIRIGNSDEEAIKMYEKSLEKGSGVEGRYALSLAYNHLKQYEEALQNLKLAFEDSSRDQAQNITEDVFYYNFGYFHQKLAETELDKTPNLRDRKQVEFHLQKSAEAYSKAINMTKNVRDIDETGAYYSERTADAAENLTAVYVMQYELSGKNSIFLAKALETMKIDFKAKQPHKRAEYMQLVLSGNDYSYLEPIRQSKEFKELVNFLNKEYKLSKFKEQ
ncbi:serine protease [Trichocoleus sp. DQ-U1]|uniref:serine protease n=1 Tax=Trichocoleus sp. DQ-U1 TaxID=2933926 RepID=UPI0032996FD0